MVRLDGIDTGALKSRRDRLRKELATRTGGNGAATSAALFSGLPRPMNYAANAYRFRASSHFLYLTGLNLEDAVLWVGPDDDTLFTTPAGPDDALWHGPLPGFDEIAAAIGCRVRPLDELAAAIATGPVASVASPDAGSRESQSARLNRDVSAPADRDIALGDALIALRLRHDDAAVAEMRRAAEATAAAHAAGMRATRPGILEAEVRAAMEAACLRRGMNLSYPPIVTVHGEILHNNAYHHMCNDGDLLLADVGAETAGGWAGDVTRTWPVSGKLSSTQREIYQIVLKSQAAAIAAVKPGTRYREVHLTASRVIAAGLVDVGILKGDADELVADGVHALLFPHGIGHLIGLDVHDMEDLGDRAGYAPGRIRSEQFGLSYLRLDRDLEPGMAVTIEPGFYVVPAILADEKLSAIAGDRLDRDRLAAFADVRGIRIEDDVLVTQTGNEVLTAAIPKSPDAIEAATGG